MMDTLGRAPGGSRAGNTRLLALGSGLALGFCVLLSAATLPQEPAPLETPAYRIHLKTGVSIDGDSLRETPRTVILIVSGGEVVVRREAIARIEVLKARPSSDGPAAEPRRPESAGDGDSMPAAQRERIEVLLRQYAAAGDQRRQELLRELVKAVPASLPFLVRKLETTEGPSRALISAALVESRTAVPAASLEPALKSRKAEVRAEAARILGGLGTSASVPLLAALDRDPSPLVRAAAVHGLGLLGSGEAFLAVRGFCSDADREVRLRALHALPGLAERNDLQARLEIAFLNAFDRSDGQARADVVVAMGISGRKGLERCLTDALRDGAPEVRAAAVTALVNLGCFEWKEWVVDRYFREDEPVVRIALAAAARSLRFPGTIEPLISWLKSPDADVVQAALAALYVLTEQNFGPDAERWETWWRSVRRR